MPRDRQPDPIWKERAGSLREPFLPRGLGTLFPLQSNTMQENNSLWSELRFPSGQVRPDFHSGIAIVEQQKIDAAIGHLGQGSGA